MTSTIDCPSALSSIHHSRRRRRCRSVGVVIAVHMVFQHVARQEESISHKTLTWKPMRTCSHRVERRGYAGGALPAFLSSPSLLSYYPHRLPPVSVDRSRPSIDITFLKSLVGALDTATGPSSLAFFLRLLARPHHGASRTRISLSRTSERDTHRGRAGRAVRA